MGQPAFGQVRIASVLRKRGLFCRRPAMRIFLGLGLPQRAPVQTRGGHLFAHAEDLLDCLHDREFEVFLLITEVFQLA